MSFLDRVDLPAPSNGSRPAESFQEEDPFADAHRIASEEGCLYEGPLSSKPTSAIRPAELLATEEPPFSNLRASTNQQSASTSSPQPRSRVTPLKANTTPLTTSSNQAGNRQPQRRDTGPVPPSRLTAAPFADPRPVRERLPSEYYMPPVTPRTDRSLPRATDVNGRYILKSAVSRAALQLAGIDFAEGSDHVMLYVDPGPIGLRDLRAASIAMQHPADWWRGDELDAPAYPHAPVVANDTLPATERRDARWRGLGALWKRRGREMTGSNTAGLSRENAAGGPSHVRRGFRDGSDSEDERPVKHTYQ